MGFTDYLKTKLYEWTKKAADIPVGLVRIIGGANRGFNWSGKKNSELYDGWVFASIRAIAEEVGGIDVVLAKMDSGGNKEIILDHPAIKTLNYVNDYFSKYMLFERLQSDLEIDGNEYWYLQTDKKGIPQEIYPLVIGTVTPVADEFTYIKWYQYKLGTQTYIIPKENMVHFKTFNPNSDILGMSTIQAARIAIETNDAAAQYNRAFFENSAQPGVILEVPGELKEPDSKRLKEQWDQEFGGFKKNYRTAVASNGLKVTKLEISHADMEFMEQRKFSRDEILSLFRVPKTVLGILEDANFAAAKTSDYVFARWTIRPKMMRIVDQLNEFYLPHFGDPTLKFELRYTLPDDKVEQTAYYTAGLNNGWLTPNEIRRMEGLPELEDGDNTLLPFSLTPGSKPKQKALPLRTTPMLKMASEIAAAIVKSVKAETKEVEIEPIKKGLGSQLQATSMDSKTFEVIGQKKSTGAEKRAKKWEKKWGTTLNTLFDSQKETALKNLEKELGKKEWKKSAMDLIGEEEQLKTTIDLFTPLMMGLVSEEGQEAYDLLGLDEEFDSTRAGVRRYIEKNTKKFAGSVTDTTSREIRALIVAGIEQNESIDELKDRIINYSGFDAARAELIARTEVSRGQTGAEQTAWKESGVVTAMIWYTAEDERVDEDCADLHGKEVDIGDNFLSADELTGAGINPYDGALNGPPLHPNCRCTLVPVVSGKGYKPDAEKLMAFYLDSL